MYALNYDHRDISNAVSIITFLFLFYSDYFNLGWDVIDHDFLEGGSFRNPVSPTKVVSHTLHYYQLRNSPLLQDNDIPAHKIAMMLLVLTFFSFYFLFILFRQSSFCALFWPGLISGSCRYNHSLTRAARYNAMMYWPVIQYNITKMCFCFCSNQQPGSTVVTLFCWKSSLAMSIFWSRARACHF